MLLLTDAKNMAVIVQRERLMRHRLFHLVVATFLFGSSGRAENSTHRAAERPTNPGWTSICLDRVVFEFPSDVEMGATRIKYKGARLFAEMDDFYADGPKWGDVAIAETFPTDAKGYESVRTDVAHELARNNLDLKNTIEEARDGVRRWTKNSKEGTPEEMTAANLMLAEQAKRLADAEDAMRASGQASLPQGGNAFAFRRRFEYVAGYLDDTDHRARIFEGLLSTPHSASPNAAADDFKRIKQIYHARRVDEIPSGPGYCTGFGFIDETNGAERKATIDMPFRTKKYPNLIFTLIVDPGRKGNIQETPQMSADKAKLDRIGILRSHGPYAVSILGSPGRTFAQEYKAKDCRRSDCEPSSLAYDVEAETYGELGNLAKPHLILRMRAALADDYKTKLTAIPGNESSLKVRRLALRGKTPPTYEDGMKVFEQVLRSIRLRPGAITNLPHTLVQGKQ